MADTLSPQQCVATPFTLFCLLTHVCTGSDAGPERLKAHTRPWGRASRHQKREYFGRISRRPRPKCVIATHCRQRPGDRLVHRRIGAAVCESVRSTFAPTPSPPSTSNHSSYTQTHVPSPPPSLSLFRPLQISTCAARRASRQGDRALAHLALWRPKP